MEAVYLWHSNKRQFDWYDDRYHCILFKQEMYTFVVYQYWFFCVYTKQYQFCASYFELYNEDIRDLAKGSNDEGKKVTKGVTENARTSKPIITEKEVKTTEEVRENIIIGNWRLSDLNNIFYVRSTCGMVILTKLT